MVPRHNYSCSAHFDRMMMLLSGLKQLTFCVVRVLNVSTKLPTFVLNVQAVLVHLTNHYVMPVDRACSIPKWKCRLRAVYYDYGDLENYGDSVNPGRVLDFDCGL